MHFPSCILHRKSLRKISNAFSIAQLHLNSFVATAPPPLHSASAPDKLHCSAPVMLSLSGKLFCPACRHRKFRAYWLSPIPGAQHWEQHTRLPTKYQPAAGSCDYGKRQSLLRRSAAARCGNLFMIVWVRCVVTRHTDAKSSMWICEYVNCDILATCWYPIPCESKFNVNYWNSDSESLICFLCALKLYLKYYLYYPNLIMFLKW